MPVLWGRAFHRCAALEWRLGAAAPDAVVYAVLQAQLSRGAAACSIVVPSYWDWLWSEPVDAAQPPGNSAARGSTASRISFDFIASPCVRRLGRRRFFAGRVGVVVGAPAVILLRVSAQSNLR